MKSMLIRAAVPDAELLSRYRRSRDRAAFADLVARHGPAVWAACRSLLADADAEDAFQATFLQLARRADSVRRADALGAWLRAAARSAALQKLRSARRREKHERSAAGPASVAPADELTWREARTALAEEIERLPEKLRAAFTLCCEEGHGRADAARALGVPAGTVGSRVDAAKRRLRVRLSRRGIDLSAALGAASLTGAASAVTPALREAAVNAAMRAGSSLVWPVPLTLAAVLCASVAAVGFGGDGKTPPSPPAAMEPADPLPPGAVARLGTARLRHGGLIRSVRFSPDGRSIVTAGGDRVRLWGRATGAPRGELDAGSPVREALFAPGGGIFYRAAGRKELSAWRPGSERPGEPLRLPGEPNRRATATHAGRVAVWVQDGVKLYTRGGKLLGTCPCNGADSVAFSPDGERLAVVDSPRRLLMFDVSEPTGGRFDLLWDRPGVRAKTREARAAFAPDGKSVAFDAPPSALEILDAATGKLTGLIDAAGGGEPGVAYLPGGRLVTARGSAVWDVDGGPPVAGRRGVTAGRLVCTFPPPAGGVADIAVSPDGRTVAAAGTRAVRLYDAETGKVLDTGRGPGDVIHTLAVAPDGRELLTAGDGPRQLRRWDLRTMRPLPTPTFAWVGRAAAYSPDGELIAAGGRAGPGLIDRRTGKLVRRCQWPDRGRFDFLAFSTDGRTLYGGTAGEHTIQAWDAATGRRAFKIGRWPPPLNFPADSHTKDAAAVSPDGKLMAVGLSHGGVSIYDTATRKTTFGSYGHGQLVRSVAFSPDGRLVAAASARDDRVFGRGKPGPNISIWRTAPSPIVVKPTLTLAGAAAGNRCVAFSPDGRSVAAAGEDGVVRVWELATGGLRAELAGHDGPVTCVAYLPDGRLASAGSDTTVLIWQPWRAGSKPR